MQHLSSPQFTKFQENIMEGSKKKKERIFMSSVTMYTFLTWFAVILSLFLLMKYPDQEDLMMTELGSPPAWSMFILTNGIADTLRSIADKITPPQIEMMSIIGKSHHKLGLAYVLQKFKIPDFIGDGTGSKTVKEIAAYTETNNEMNVERILYACAALGMLKLEAERTFVNSPLSSVLRRDHPLFTGRIKRNDIVSIRNEKE